MSIYHSGTLVLEEVLKVGDNQRDVRYHDVNISLRYFGLGGSTYS